jgi:hypothetical protein
MYIHLQMKLQQDDLERELWQERQSIQRRHEGKVNVRRMEYSLSILGVQSVDANICRSEKLGKPLRKEEAEVTRSDFSVGRKVLRYLNVDDGGLFSTRFAQV